MSFVLVNKTDRMERYSIRCDRCGATTEEADVIRADIQKGFETHYKRIAGAQLAQLCRSCKYKRHGDKHLCPACEATRKTETQLSLLDLGARNPQPWCTR